MTNVFHVLPTPNLILFRGETLLSDATQCQPLFGVSVPSMASGWHGEYQPPCHLGLCLTDTTTHTPDLTAIASRPARPSEEVLMATGLSWFPMVQCFYEQLEAIMEMRVLSRA